MGAIGPRGANWWSGWLRRSQVLMRYTRLTFTFVNFPTTYFHHIWPQHVNGCPVEDFIKEFAKIFCLGIICRQKREHWRGQTVPYSDQPTAQRTHCREMWIIHVLMQGPGTFPTLVNFSCCVWFGATGRQISQIFAFLSASLYVSKRGAYWDRLCRDVVGRWLVGRWLVGWSSRACTVAKRCILGL